MATTDLVPSTRSRSVLRSRSVTVVLVLPVIAFFVLMFVWPLIDIVIRSLSQGGVISWANFSVYWGNYSAVVGNSVLRLIELRTIELAAKSTALALLLGFPTAYFISRLQRRTAGIVLLLVLVPFWVSIVVRIFSVASILSPNGLVGSTSDALGLGRISLLYTSTGTLIGTTMYLLPYMILILYAGMASIDHNLLSAARTLGASPAQAFLRVYLRMLRPSIFSGVLLVFILSLSFFIVPALLGGPQDQTIAVYIQQQINIYQWGTASAVGILLLIATVLLYAIVVRLSGSFSPGAIAGVQSKGVASETRFRWSVGTVVSGIFALVSVIVLVVPMIMVFPLSVGTTQTVLFPPQGFSLKAYGDVFQGSTWLGPLLQSTTVAVLTGLISVVISLVLARTIRRIRGRTTRAVVTGLVFAPLIAPAILLAIGIYDIEIQLRLVGTLAGLTLAHVVISFPLAFAVIDTAMNGVDPSLEHAAWTLGASRTRAFWTVTVRSILPSVVGGFGLAFVSSWDEVILALFLQTGPIKTLPVTIYRYLQSGIVPAVPAVASMLILLVGVVLLVRWLIGKSRIGRIAQERRTP